MKHRTVHTIHFLRPTHKKLELFVIIFVLMTFVQLYLFNPPFPLAVLKDLPSACNSIMKVPTMTSCAEVHILYENLFINGIVYYVLACAIVVLMGKKK